MTVAVRLPVLPKMTLAQAKAIAGSLSFPSKMPGTSYGLPMNACRAGKSLMRMENTSCSKCYAARDKMSWPNALKAQDRRLRALSDPRWGLAMVMLLAKTHEKPFRQIDLGLRPGPKLKRLGTRFRLNAMGFHRWHDSGDLQSAEHFAKICEVARLTPAIKHWLPTQELRFVKAFLEAGGRIPPNLVVRVSSIMIDDHRPRSWPLTASVFSGTAPSNVHVCPAPDQGHFCGSCRACWDSNVAHVAYAAH